MRAGEAPLLEPVLNQYRLQHSRCPIHLSISNSHKVGKPKRGFQRRADQRERNGGKPDSDV